MMSICVYTIILLFISVRLLSQKPPFSLSGIKMSSPDDDHIKHAIISIKWEYSWTNPLTILQRKLSTVDLTFLHRNGLGVHMSYKKVKHAHDSVGPSHSGLRGPGGFLKHGVTTHIVEHHAVTRIVTRPEISTLPPTWMKLCNKGNGSKYTPSFFSPLPLLSPFVW